MDREIYVMSWNEENNNERNDERSWKKPCMANEEMKK